MNIYHFPGTGIYGGIKVGYQFAALLNDLGVPTVAATPDGSAPQWFRAAVPTISHEDARRSLARVANVLFSYPPDYVNLLMWNAPLVVHCQGTDDRMDPVFANPDVRILTCWPQARSHVRTLTGRETIEVGISVSGDFYYGGEDKLTGTVAYMPRRGNEIVTLVRRQNRGLRFSAIKGADEAKTAAIMKRSEFYLATSVGEQFGLPAFEAMAAGCVVVSVPVVGGMDYLRHGENCIVAAPADLPGALAEIAREEHAPLRARLRQSARVTAMEFLASQQRARVAKLLGGELGFLRPQNAAGGNQPRSLT